MAQSPLDTRLASLGLIFGAAAIGYYYYTHSSAGPSAPLPPGSLSDSGGGGFLGSSDVAPTSTPKGTIDFGAYKPAPLTGPGMSAGETPTAQQFNDAMNRAIAKARGQ